LKNILVTGGAGFIGSNYIHSLLKSYNNYKIINYDVLTYSGSLENLRDIESDSRYKFVKGDICEIDSLNSIFREYKIDTVIHFAAETHVDRSIISPEKFVQTNIMGTFSLLETARQNWSEDGTNWPDQFRFHHVSTDEVFGTLSEGDLPWDEKTAYAPNSPYSASKASSDHLVRAYGHTYGLPYTISNCSNNYGPYQFPEKLIPLVINNALEGKTLPIYGDGKQRRDWLFVTDHCEAINLILEKGRVGSNYNIGGGNQPTNLQLVETICDLLDELKPGITPRRNLIKFIKDRPGHDRRYAIDSTKIRNELGWQPKYTLENGLRKTVSWYLDHGDWNSIIQKQLNFKVWINKNYKER
jgi:dTDP-glucose 4,6-dehydratase